VRTGGGSGKAGRLGSSGGANREVLRKIGLPENLVSFYLETKDHKSN